MKKLFLINAVLLGVLFLCTEKATAQIAVSIQSSHKNYLTYERILVKVKFRNYSGRGLVFGKLKALRGAIRFKINTPDGKKLYKPLKDTSILEGIVLKPGATGEVIVPITDIYHLEKAGNYTISAEITHPQLMKPYVSPSISFSIINGIPVWKRIVGVPDVLGLKTKEKIKTRTITILNFYDGDKKLYALRIEDKEFIYGVVRLADDVDEDAPLCEIDGLSNIHVLIHVGSRFYAYFVYDINCKLDEYTVYMQDKNVIPTMIRNPEDGVVMIIGGKKAEKGVDY